MEGQQHFFGIAFLDVSFPCPFQRSQRMGIFGESWHDHDGIQMERTLLGVLGITFSFLLFSFIFYLFV